MQPLQRISGFVRALRKPSPVPRVKPTQAQKDEITDAIRKQRFRGDLAGRLEY